MPNITLPDDSVRSFDGPVDGHELASAIGPGLAKSAMMMIVDGNETVSYTHLRANETLR